MCTEVVIVPESRVPTARSVLVTSAFKFRAVAEVEEEEEDTRSITCFSREQCTEDRC